MEAEDLRYLWTVKYHGAPEKNLRNICRKILIGRPEKNIPVLKSEFDILDFLPKINMSWTIPKALNFIGDELELRMQDVMINYNDTIALLPPFAGG